jgi:RNA polymerase sigma-70 factor (ECF subfamily)
LPTDLELLERWRAGDDACGSALFERHFDALCRFFRNKLAGDGVDDLIQRTFLALVENRGQFRGDASFRTYLFTVARHELFAHFKRSAREQTRFDPLAQSVHDHGPSPTNVLAQRGEQRLLLEALRRIPIDLQVVLELYYWEDLAAPELARVLEVPEGTVRTRIRRGRQLLEAALAEIGSGAAELHATLAGLEDWARSIRAVAGRPG